MVQNHPNKIAKPSASTAQDNWKDWQDNNVEQENQNLLSKAQTKGVTIKLNPRKSAIQQNISLWQALAANGLCPPGTFGEHAKRALSQEENKVKDGENPIQAHDPNQSVDPIQKEFNSVKLAVEQALYWRDVDTW